MGCDIHMYVEKKRNGKWIPAQGFFLVYEDSEVPDVPWVDRFTDRDYLLFGFLAGVRDPTNQAFEPRGFPKDASKEVRRVFTDDGPDAHTPSYLTVAEIMEAMENRMIKIHRLFPKDRLSKFKESVDNGKPDYDLVQSWCSYASDRENWEEAEIEVPIRVQFSRFYQFLIKARAYGDHWKDDEVRLVFWFDN